MEIFEASSLPDRKVNVFQVEENISLVSTSVHHEIGTTGIFSLLAIAGSFDILGIRLTPSSSPVKVYSTKEFSLKITPLPKSKNIVNEAYLKSLNITKNVKKAALAHFSGVDNLLMIVLIEDSANYMKYIEGYMEMPIFANKMFEKNVITFNPSNYVRCKSIGIHSEWDHWGSMLTKPSKKVVLCGGKGVGKSTLLKYLINRSIASNSQALVLDFDPGQPEFTVMGSVSAVLVTRPLLGPNFSHLTAPVMCLYLGCIAVTDCSKEYMACVNKIIELCSSTAAYQDIPWFINTMGFVKGLGITLLKDIILSVQPTDVIQIQSRIKMDNLPGFVTPKFVVDTNYSSEHPLNYKLHTMWSMAGNTDAPNVPRTGGISAAKKRSLVVLSYFYDMVKNASFNFLECVPYRINVKDIHIVVTVNDVPIELEIFHKLSSINGTMVALCDRENESEFLEWKGFGIVRGVDFEKEEVYISTPMTESELKQVNVIHMNSTIQLPRSVLKKQEEVTQIILPYMARIYSSRMNQLIGKSTSRIRPYTVKSN